MSFEINEPFLSMFRPGVVQDLRFIFDCIEAYSTMYRDDFHPVWEHDVSAIWYHQSKFCFLQFKDRQALVLPGNWIAVSVKEADT